MENQGFDSFINTNNELPFFMDPAVDPNNVEEEYVDVDQLDTFSYDNGEQSWPAEFTVYSSGATPLQEQPVQPVADGQSFVNDTDNTTFAMDTLTNGDPLIGSYTGMLGWDGNYIPCPVQRDLLANSLNTDVDLGDNFQTWTGDAEKSTVQEPASEQDQTLPSAVTGPRPDEHNIESPSQYKTSNSKKRSRVQDEEASISQKRPRYGSSHIPLPPNTFGGHMEPHWFDQQATNHTENAGMNQALPLLPEIQLEMPRDFADIDRAPSPSGNYSTPLNRPRNPMVRDRNFGNARPTPGNTEPPAEREILGSITPTPGDNKPSVEHANFGGRIPAPGKNKSSLEREILGGIIPASRRVRRKPVNGGSSDEPANKSKRLPWEHRLESHFPRVHMLEEEAEAVEKNYKDNPRKAFEDLSKAKKNMKAIHIDWEQMELLNSIRQTARKEEKERKRRCKPEDYIPKNIPADYKPKARLLKCYNAWLTAKREHGMVTNSWTERNRRTADKKLTSTYSGIYSLGTSDGGTSILEDYVQPSGIEEFNNSEVQKRKKAMPQEASENFDGEEIGTKRT
ncbi:hypothetical protein EYC84_002206 [Monilinia fructicola]|uniref:Uncharacterized protein n=1 Tax=Monilinia fructicola TaxID=38448 RepID=A0A5M9JN82_MONFR|nr:hypothetical protein EYC84_002206 [Monilinia fructicola]